MRKTGRKFFGSSFSKSKKGDDRRNAEKAIARLAGGLEKELRLAVGARVMLRRNVNPRLGLVNGATGTVLIVKYV